MEVQPGGRRRNTVYQSILDKAPKNEKGRKGGQPVIIEALGQTWHFTPEVVRLLRVSGDEPQDTLKRIILAHGSMKGYDEGVYEVESFGITIRFTIHGETILVDDPHA